MDLMQLIVRKPYPIISHGSFVSLLIFKLIIWNSFNSLFFNDDQHQLLSFTNLKRKNQNLLLRHLFVFFYESTLQIEKKTVQQRKKVTNE